MKKRMKMKKYAEGGMSDDDEGYDAYTTRVVDEDTDEVVYEKPEAKVAQRGASAKPAMRVDDSREMRRAGPVSGSRKFDDTSAVTGRARAGRSSMSAEEKTASNKAMREDVLPEALMLGASAVPVVGGAAALGLKGLRAAKAAKNAKYLAEQRATPMGKKIAKRVDRIEKEARRDRNIEKPMGVTKDIGMGYRKGGSVKSSASRRADGIAQRGKTKGRVI